MLVRWADQSRCSSREAPPQLKGKGWGVGGGGAEAGRSIECSLRFYSRPLLFRDFAIARVSESETAIACVLLHARSLSRSLLRVTRMCTSARARAHSYREVYIVHDCADGDREGRQGGRQKGGGGGTVFYAQREGEREREREREPQRERESLREREREREPQRERERGGERERESLRERESSKTLSYEDFSLGSVKNLFNN